MPKIVIVGAGKKDIKEGFPEERRVALTLKEESRSLGKLSEDRN